MHETDDLSSSPPTIIHYPGAMEYFPAQLEKLPIQKKREIKITYRFSIYNEKVNDRAEFGFSNDVESFVHFELPEIYPEGTVIYLLHPKEQSTVRADGLIVKGIPYLTKEDFRKDVNSAGDKLADFCYAFRNSNIRLVCEELISKGQCKLPGGGWYLSKVVLP